MKKSKLFIVLCCLAFLMTSCATEYLGTNKFAEVSDTAHVENLASRFLFQQMRKQPGNYEKLIKMLKGKIPLYEQAELMQSSEFGPYYEVPYTNLSGTVEGKLIYPFDEHKPFEERKFMGLLDTPFLLDSQLLNKRLPENSRYLYSSFFRKLKEKYGDKLSPSLTEFADKMDEQLKKKTRSSAVAGVHEANIAVNFMTTTSVDIWGGSVIVTTQSIRTIMTQMQMAIRDVINQEPSKIRYDGYLKGEEGFHRISFRLSFDPPKSEEDVRYLIDRILLQTNQNIEFNVSPLAFVYFWYSAEFSLCDIRTGVSFGTSTGYGGTNPASPRKTPCADTYSGKANPLMEMSLMPPNSYNLDGATFGRTRRYTDGSPKFHQGVDLYAEVGTPVYSMFDGVVARIEDTQPNKIWNGQKWVYPSGYTGDMNGAGNRIYIQSTVNGTVIVVAYWHLQAEKPIERGITVNSHVTSGQLIGYTGITGNASERRPHLHLGIQKNGKWIDPFLYLNATRQNQSIYLKTPCD